MIPLIDVMLVLLIVFMLITPLLTHAIPVNLPQTEAQTTLATETNLLEITILADGSLYYETQPASREILQQYLNTQKLTETQRSIQILAGENVPYRFVAVWA